MQNQVRIGAKQEVEIAREAETEAGLRGFARQYITPDEYPQTVQISSYQFTADDAVQSVQKSPWTHSQI
jgi:hypothetical protein